LIPIPGPVWRYGAAFVLGAVLAATAQGWRYTAKIATAEAAVSSERAEAMRLVVTEQNRSAEKVRQADEKYTGELADAESKITELDRRVAAGSSGLRVAVKCPKPRELPQAAPPAGLGSGNVESAELDPAVRPDYIALRRGIVRLETALKVCVEGR